jgi:hypothetical protein
MSKLPLTLEEVEVKIQYYEDRVNICLIALAAADSGGMVRKWKHNLNLNKRKLGFYDWLRFSKIQKINSL